MPTPEELARQNIDTQLNACGRIIQDRTALNLYAARGVIESNPKGTTLSGVAAAPGNIKAGF